MMRCFCMLMVALLFYSPLTASAQDQGSFGQVIRIERNAFSADAGLITFSEFSVGSRNPFYTGVKYGGKVGSVAVTFGGYYIGQRLASAGQCPAGANRQGCVISKPASPLQFDSRSPTTFIAEDSSNPTSPSLSGSPRFNGPVSIIFDKDIAGVGLAGGYFDAVKSTAITAYDRNGNKIGGVKNLSIGMEYMALVTEDGSNRIAGLQFSLVGSEPQGYAIDELSFAFAEQIDRSQVPRLSDALDSVVNPTMENAGEKNRAGGLSGLFEGNNKPAKVEPSDNASDRKRKPAGGLTDLFKTN